MKKVMAGIDLHSNNLVVAIMDQDGKRVGQQKLPCELKAVVKFLAPFKKRLEQVAVESTYNWYWSFSFFGPFTLERAHDSGGHRLIEFKWNAADRRTTCGTMI